MSSTKKPAAAGTARPRKEHKKKPRTGGKASTLKDVDPHRFIRAYAQRLKQSGQVKLPEWVEYVKTAPSRELAPQDPDWFFTRLAAVARRIYIRPGVGLSGLRKVFGQANYQKHVVTSHNALASGGAIRHALQILGELGVLETRPAGGRQVSPKGRKEMDLVAQGILMDAAAAAAATVTAARAAKAALAAAAAPAAPATAAPAAQ